MDIRERVCASCLLSLVSHRYLKTFELSALLTEIVSGKGKGRWPNEVDGLRAPLLFFFPQMQKLVREQGYLPPVSQLLI